MPRHHKRMLLHYACNTNQHSLKRQTWSQIKTLYHYSVILSSKSRKTYLISRERVLSYRSFNRFDMIIINIQEYRLYSFFLSLLSVNKHAFYVSNEPCKLH